MGKRPEALAEPDGYDPVGRGVVMRVRHSPRTAVILCLTAVIL